MALLKIYLGKLVNCANLQTSFGTDWFSALDTATNPDLDLAANSK